MRVDVDDGARAAVVQLVPGDDAAPQLVGMHRGRHQTVNLVQHLRLRHKHGVRRTPLRSRNLRLFKVF